MPIKAFSTAPTQPIKQKDLSICLFQTRKMTFFQVFKNANVFVNSVLCNVSTSSLSIDIIARFFSLLSDLVDLWNIFISLSLQKLRLAVLRTAVIGKFSLEWPQTPFPCESAEIFPWGGQHRHFACVFKVAGDAMQGDVHKVLYPFFVKGICSILWH